MRAIKAKKKHDKFAFPGLSNPEPLLPIEPDMVG